MNTSIISTKGVEATSSFEDTLISADLKWQVREDKVAGADTGCILPHKKLLYRSDNNEALGVVGEDYSASDPAAFLQSQYDVAGLVGGKVVRAGFMPERSRAFAFVEMGEEMTLPKNLRRKGDPVRCYIYSTDGWDGGTPRRSRLFLERVACTNSVMSKEIKAKLWVSHTKGMTERYVERSEQFLKEVKQNLSVVREQFITIAKQSMDKDGMLAFLVKLMPSESSQAKKTRNSILDLFESGTEVAGKTRWDAFNAVTEYVTHHRQYRTTDNTPVETNRFLGILENDTTTDRALSLLLTSF